MIFLFRYVKSINKNEISELVKNEDNVKTIINIIKRYISFYLIFDIRCILYREK